MNALMVNVLKVLARYMGIPGFGKIHGNTNIIITEILTLVCGSVKTLFFYKCSSGTFFLTNCTNLFHYFYTILNKQIKHAFQEANKSINALTNVRTNLLSNYVSIVEHACIRPINS